MIYTIGHRQSYLQYFEEGCPEVVPMKKGRRDDYLGGSVWQSFDEAATHIRIYKLIGFAVFGVMADWETDVAKNPNAHWHNLLVDAEIVLLEGVPDA